MYIGRAAHSNAASWTFRPLPGNTRINISLGVQIETSIERNNGQPDGTYLETSWVWVTFTIPTSASLTLHVNTSTVPHITFSMNRRDDVKT